MFFLHELLFDEFLHFREGDVLRRFHALEPDDVIAELGFCYGAYLPDLCQFESCGLVFGQERTLRVKSHLAARYLCIRVYGISLCELDEILSARKLFLDLPCLFFRFQKNVACIDLALLPELFLVGIIEFLEIFIRQTGA